MEYTAGEYTDMHMLFGEFHGNAFAAACAYAQRYPARRHPDSNVIRRLDQRMREGGSVTPITSRDRGRPYATRTPEVEQLILDMIDEDPTISIRLIARRTGVNKNTVHSILRDEGLHAYHYTRVQRLLPEDYHRRIRYCTWLQQRHQHEPGFTGRILWSDEARFTREGMFNAHNSHVWARVNPQVTRDRGYQVRWGVNVWAGVVGDMFIGPYLLPDRLTAARYEVFLRTVLPQLLDDVPLAVRRGLWLQHDGAPPHHGVEVRRFLDEMFPGRWIGRGGPVEWPPRSPDLNPLDFFVWGYLKELVYRTPPNTPEDLVAYLHAAVTTITRDMLQRAQQSCVHRAAACCQMDGGHFQHLLM